MNKAMFQQGDVTLNKIQNLDISKGKIKARGRCTLAYGEKTGHHHTLELEENEAELIEMGDKILLKLEKQGVLRHQEHNAITLEPGIYEVGGIHEYDYFSKMVRKVVD